MLFCLSRLILAIALFLDAQALYAQLSKVHFGQALTSSPCPQKLGLFRATDLDGDGKLDMVLGGCIAWGDGTGKFDKLLAIGSGGSIADTGNFFLRPGTKGKFKDLIFCQRQQTGTSCSITAQSKARVFGPSRIIPSLSGNGLFVEWIESGDFNQDGKLDIVAAVRQSVGGGQLHGMLLLLPGNGQGLFAPPTLLDDLGNGSTQDGLGGVGLGSIAVGDLNKDGIPDISVLVKGFSEETQTQIVQLRSYLGKKSGGFVISILEGSSAHDSSGKPFQISPMSLAFGDYSGDGIPDVVITDEGGINDFPGFTTFVRNAGNGQLSFDRIFNGPNHNESVNLADVDGDGKADVLISGGSDLSQFSINSMIFNSPQNTGAIFGDINGDGRLDVIVRLPPNDKFSVLLQK